MVSFKAGEIFFTAILHSTIFGRILITLLICSMMLFNFISPDGGATESSLGFDAASSTPADREKSE